MKYTRSELAQGFNVSVETIKKWAIQYSFKTDFKLENNREIIAYVLTDGDLKKIEHDKGIKFSFETQFETIKPQFETPKESYKQSNLPESFLDKLMEYNKGVLNQFENYIERASNAEAKVNLLTTIESNKDAEINRLNALVKQYEMTIETLKKDLETERNKSFFDKLLKK